MAAAQVTLRLLCFVGPLVLISNIAVANPTGRVTHITYKSPSWNTDSRKIDTAYLILRDKVSGKNVQIQLEETEPDSAQFTGQFSVDIGQQSSPEVYIPPKELRGTDKDNKKIYNLIQAGKLPRKPTIWKKNDKGQAVLDVYDTREEAVTALRAYEEEQKLATQLKRKTPGKPMTDQQASAAAKAAAYKAQLAALALEASKRTSDRARMEQIERQKNEERERQHKAMSEKERQQRRAQAKKIGDEANELYEAGDYVKAEQKYKQALELDPDSKEYYYKYGVSLYRNQKFNEALVILKVAKVEANLENERAYFMGLVHYRLSEFENALGKFNEVGKSEDKVLAPSATFYTGVILYSQEKYEASKGAFEKVIDTSGDPRLDQQAEDYIDRIASAMAFQKMRENKWTVTGTLGLMYDSNVLLTPDSSSATATNVADARLVTSLDLQYRPILSEKNEFSPHASANLTNSSKNTAAPADPFIYTLAAPYSHNVEIGKKRGRITATPGYELLYMDPSSTGTKQKELTSYYLTLDGTLVNSKTWISSYTLEYRSEDSSDASSVGPDDMDATKYTLRTVQTLMIDKKKAIMPTLGYIKNSAKGTNKIYSRYDLGITYAAPMMWEMTWTAGLAYYNMKYPNVPRTDTNYALNLGLSKPVREWVIWGLTGNYTKNGSTVAANEYNKYLIMTTATFITNF